MYVFGTLRSALLLTSKNRRLLKRAQRKRPGVATGGKGKEH